MTNSAKSAIVARPMAAITKEAASGFQDAAARARLAFGNAVTDDFFAAFEVAAAVQELRLYLDQQEIKDRILSLMNTPIGFRTDRDPKIKRWNPKEQREVSPQPYNYDIVKDCVVEALLRGLGLVGNQFNIIAERFYCTKEGFEYLIKKQESVTDFKPIIGIPAQKPGGAIVECSATWLQHNKEKSLQAMIPVKGDEKYASADQYIGKATRKLLKRCYEMMSGNSISDGDAEDTPLAQVSSISPVFNQLPESQAVQADIAAASIPTACLTNSQIRQLQTSMASVLTSVGAQAFEIDAANGYGVEVFDQIPAARFSELMKNLGNTQFQENWNNGLSVGGEQIVEQEVEPAAEAPQPIQAAQPTQAELIPAQQPARRQDPPTRRSVVEDEL